MIFVAFSESKRTVLLYRNSYQTTTETPVQGITMLIIIFFGQQALFK